MNEFDFWLEEKEKEKKTIVVLDDPYSFFASLMKLFFPIQSDESKKTLVMKIKETLKKYLERVGNKNWKVCLSHFLKTLPWVNENLLLDLNAFIEGDPSANSKEEIILCYPGFYAILVYRIAHFFYQENIPILPRFFSEHAHSRTGIDIHPGAKIASPFFIDHGSGIVIGETTEIGSNVKIYQGVTLGAISLKEGQKLKGKKRHPTIMNGVTLYANVQVLGGDTIVGEDVVVPSNSVITKSIYKEGKKKDEN